MPSIALDGPSGAGKSTLAKAVAKKLGFIYVDTGAMYRTVGLYIYRCGISSKDKEGIISHLDKIEIKLGYIDGAQHVFLNGEDVTGLIRTPEISLYASDVSSIAQVRAKLLDMQKDMAHSGSVVMDGRDIGTVILPDADVKLYLTASPEARAARRHEELLEKGVEVSYEQVLADIRYRDTNDSTRENAPAVKAVDAVELDNSGNTFEQTLAQALKLIKEKLPYVDVQ
ncbi:MAG: (d)CMP kinase [Eubacteriales bacterium]